MDKENYWIFRNVAENYFTRESRVKISGIYKLKNEGHYQSYKNKSPTSRNC